MDEMGGPLGAGGGGYRTLPTRNLHPPTPAPPPPLPPPLPHRYLR